jgi:hypothetical protein
MTLALFPLLLGSDGPPAGYAWSERTPSHLSTTTAFNTGLNARDTFLGDLRCVICGRDEGSVLEHCHVILSQRSKAVQ